MSTSDLCAINRRHARHFPYTTTLRMGGRPGGPAVIRGSRSSLESFDATHECEHGRLPGDRLDGGAPNWPHTHPCGCWPQELPTPLRSHPTITTEEAHTLMSTDAIGTREARAAEREEEIAPFGRKKDGTPRKRPAPSPELIARQQAGRRKRKAAVTAPDAQALTAKRDLVAEALTAIEAEIDRLTQARDALRAIGQ